MKSVNERPRVVLITEVQEVVDRVRDAAAAAGVHLLVQPDAQVPPTCRTLLVGVDVAPAVVRAGLPVRTETLVVGPEGAGLWDWAGELGASGVVSLPSGSAWLVQWLHRRSRPLTQRECVVTAVFSAAGGVGASTLCAGLAVSAASEGLRPLLIDAHPGPAGVELLMTEESVPDHWSRFASIRGFLAPDELASLPMWEGVRCLGWGGSVPGRSWGDGPEVPLWQGALGSVLAAAGADHDVAVLDAGDTWLDCGQLPGRTRAVLLAPASWRGVTAARVRLAALADAFNDPPVLVLRDVGGRTDPRSWLKEFPDCQTHLLDFDPAIIDDVESGRPPGTRPRSGLARLSRSLLATIARPAAAA